MSQLAHFTEPAADFSDALSVIRDYHTFLLDLCDGLAQLVEQIELQQPNDNFTEQARQLRHDLMIAYALHHRDEEHTLFPCVKYTSRQTLVDFLAQLEADHLEIDLIWDWLAPLLQDIQRIDDYAQLSHVLRQFVQLLQRHIDSEEQVLLPEIEQVLTMEQRERIGASMKQHRLGGGTP